MRSSVPAFLAGATLAATITALLVSAPAAANHSDQVAIVQRDELLATIDDLADEADGLARAAQSLDGKGGRGHNGGNVGRKVARRAERLAANLHALAHDVRQAPRLAWDFDAPGAQPGPYEPQPGPYPAPAAMTPADFGAFLAAIDQAAFSSDKLAMIQTTAPHAWFTAAQVVRVMNELPHSTDKLAAAKTLWPRLVDPQNGYLVYDALPFASDKDALRKATAATQY